MGVGRLKRGMLFIWGGRKVGGGYCFGGVMANRGCKAEQ